MKWVGWLMAACIAMALLKLAVAVLAIALCILLLWGAINRPSETVALLAILAVISLARSNPVAFFALVGVIFAASLIGKVTER